MSLVAALKQPGDAAPYQQAEAALAKLPEPVAWRLQCQNVLGPSPARFNSLDDWRQYKTEIRYIFDTPEELALLNTFAATFGAGKDKRANEWTVFLFPPTQWEWLVLGGLLRAEELAAIRSNRWAKAASLSSDFVEFAALYHEYSFSSSGKIEIPFIEIMLVAIAMNNGGALVDSDLASEVLPLVNVANIDAGKIHKIIRAAENASQLPHTWATAFFSVAIQLDGVNLVLLSEFWAAVNLGRKDPVSFQLIHRQIDFVKTMSVVADLLRLGTDGALDLAAQIVSACPEVSPETSNEMNRRAALRLSEKNLPVASVPTLVRCLLTSRPTIEEVKVYSDQSLFGTILDSTSHVEMQIVKRFNIMPQQLSKDQFPTLRHELKKVLSNKENYSPEICAAALDSLIQLDVIGCPPISEADWQIGS